MLTSPALAVVICSRNGKIVNDNTGTATIELLPSNPSRHLLLITLQFAQLSNDTHPPPRPAPGKSSFLSRFTRYLVRLIISTNTRSLADINSPLSIATLRLSLTRADAFPLIRLFAAHPRHHYRHRRKSRTSWTYKWTRANLSMDLLLVQTKSYPSRTHI